MSAAVLAYIIAALQALPGLISAGSSVEAFVAGLISDIQGFQSTGGEPTAAQWQALNAQMQAALTALLAAKPA